MRNKRHIILFLLFFVVVATFVSCDNKEAIPDPLIRAKVDGFNKEAFLNRYKDPEAALQDGYAALQLINDSIPFYEDGLLRAWNSLAFNYFMLGLNDSSYYYVDQVLQFSGSSDNAEVEQVVALLLRARLEQRNCLIANSYQILYDIDQSNVLDRNSDNFLYSYALMEYYITSLTLNYHYRNGAMDNVEHLIDEIEERLPDLRCDYAEDMALNYALAHAYYRLSADHDGDLTLLRKSLDYLDENLRILDNPDAYCLYHHANVYQLWAFITADPNINPTDSLAMFSSVDFGLEMFRQSTEMFFLTPDPYQHLGAVVSAADYCMLVGDTALAWDYYYLAIDDSTWNDGFAPKFESMFYRGLVASGYSDDAELNRRWVARELELLDYIYQNQRADFMLQTELARSKGAIRFYVGLVIGIFVLLIVMAVLMVKLRNRSCALRDETVRLQQAKQKDVERIANVETCLSVLRHDITPFVVYLQNKNLPDELKNDIIDQLVRTFQNIKNWTNLSIPSGLRFRESAVAVQSVFDSVEASVPNFRSENLRISFTPSLLMVRGDAQLLEILLRNLVKNAIQYTRQGEVAVTAVVDEEDDRFVHFRVADTGCGMPPDQLEEIFRADKKIKSQEAGEEGYGSGFGLILCRYIVKKHDDNTLRGCRIWAESIEGEGTTFHFLIARVLSE